MRRIVPLSASLASLLALCACGDQTLTERRFESVTDLRAAVVDVGVACDSERISQGEGYAESLRCGQNVWLTVFRDEGQKDLRTDEYDEQGSTYIEGANWVVVAPEEILEQVTN